MRYKTSDMNGNIVREGEIYCNDNTIDVPQGGSTVICIGPNTYIHVKTAGLGYVSLIQTRGETE